MKKGMYAPKPHYGFASTLRAVFTSPVWVILLLAALVLTLGVVVGYSVARLHFLFPMVVIAAIPVSLVLVHQPFNAIVIWLLVAPFFVITPDVPTRVVYWVTYRALIPSATIIALVNGITRKRLRFDLAEFSLLVYLLINVFSVLYHYSDNPIPMFQHVYEMALVGATLFWLIRMTAPREVQLKRLMVAFIAVSVVQGSVGLMMNIPATRVLLPEAWAAVSAERTTGTLGRVAEFSVTLAASMLLVAHYAFYVRKRLIQILCLVALLVGSLCLVFSFSRGTWLASTITAALVLLLYPRLRPYIFLMALIIVLVLSASLFADSVAFAAERLDYQRTIDSRIISDSAALRMIAAKPLLGWGYFNFTRYHLDFIRPVGDTPLTDIYTSSHHTYLGMAAEIGLIGLMAYFMPYLLLLKRSFTVYKRLPREGFYSRYLLLVLWLGVAFHFVECNFMNMRLAPWGVTWIWLLLGLIASILDASEELPHSNTVNFPTTNSLITTRQDVWAHSQHKYDA